MTVEIFTKTGEGMAALAAFKTVTSLSHSLTIAGPLVTFQSGTAVKRLMHAGWWGVVVGIAAPANAGVLWWKYVELQNESFKVALNGGADGIIWHLNPGCTLVMNVGP